MPTKALTFTDLHLSISHLDDRIEWMLENFLVQIKEQDPSVIICTGDIFNRNKPSARAIEFATKWFGELSKLTNHVVLIPGNHDIDSIANCTALDYLDDISDNIEIIYEPKTVMGILLMPYQRHIDTQDLKRIDRSEQLFIHQGIDTVAYSGQRKYGQRPDAVPAERLIGKQLVVCGHIHNPTYMPDDNVWLLGSPYQLNYADPMLERGFGVWDIENPSSFQVIEYGVNYYLAKINVNVTSDRLERELMEVLPTPEEGIYYDILVTVEGKSIRKELQVAREAVADLFANKLDNLSFNYVLPGEQRAFYTTLKKASTIVKDGNSPTDMVASYMDFKANAFYKANPELREMVLQEFDDIHARVQELERGDNVAKRKSKSEGLGDLNGEETKED